MSEINRLSNGRPFKCPECGSMFCQDYSCMPRHGTGTLPTPPEGVGICEDCIHKTICSQYNGAPRSVLQCMTSCPDHLKASEVKPSPAPKTGEGVDEIRFKICDHYCHGVTKDEALKCSIGKCNFRFIEPLLRQARVQGEEEGVAKAKGIAESMLIQFNANNPLSESGKAYNAPLNELIDTLKGESK